jgi:hypothetical protein
MKTNPMTEEEILRANVLPDGKYAASVFDASDTDKHGNPLLTNTGVEKISVVLEVCGSDGSPKKINLTLTPAFPKILKHFCDAANLSSFYQNNDLSAEIVKTAKPVVVKLSSRQYKNKMGEDVITNNIDDIYPIESLEEKKESFNDEVPF